MRVSADPSVQMTDVQAKRYYDIAMDLHDMQRRATEMATALSQLNTQMTELDGKSSAWPAAVKTQFDATKKELETIRVKFRLRLHRRPLPVAEVAAVAAAAAAATAPTDFPGRLGSVKTLMMAFQDNPSVRRESVQRSEGVGAEGDSRRQRRAGEGDDAQPGAEEVRRHADGASAGQVAAL